MDRLEEYVAELVRSRAVHVRKGTVLGAEDWQVVLDHLREEVEEFADALDGSDVDEQVIELADILGIVVHAANKLQVSMDTLGSLAVLKLTKRFRTPANG
jgi:predicted house-cleaning noncanonical NTP pyrophosphatase (MazG superfamily)